MYIMCVGRFDNPDIQRMLSSPKLKWTLAYNACGYDSIYVKINHSETSG